ncbi:hypothetical protein MTO96_047941 [Rhipicephalus appendiculatus]
MWLPRRVPSTPWRRCTRTTSDTRKHSAQFPKASRFSEAHRVPSFPRAKETGATPSCAARTQDGRKGLVGETPPITNTAAPEGTDAVGDVSSGQGRRHRRHKKIKDTNDSIEKASRKRSKVDTNYTHPRRSKKSRAKKSSSSGVPKAVTVHVPDQVPPLFGHAACISPRDFGSEASLAPHFGATVGAAARPAT